MDGATLNDLFSLPSTVPDSFATNVFPTILDYVTDVGGALGGRLGS